MVRPILATPARMVEADGSIHFGTYDVPFRDVNILDAPLHAFPTPRFWKNFRLKEWQHFGLITPAHYFGAVIFDAKFMGVSFFYVYDRLQNTLFEYAGKCSSRLVKVAAQVYEGACLFEARGYRLRFENRLDAGFHRILIDVDGDAKRPGIQGDVVIHEDLRVTQPLVQVSPITRLRPFYTHKAAVPASGAIRVGSQDVRLDRDASIAVIDEQKTYYPYVSFWKWSMGAGYNADKKIVAFNLCQNMIAGDEDANENCVWVDGKITCLKAARFEMGDAMNRWKISTTDKSVALSFLPQGQRVQKINIAGLIRSDFRQPFGLYNGTFRDDAGMVHAVSNVFGLAEEHVTRY
ncbi:MAG: DUF2804 domain-containing protein [Smithellaceae bacterium]